MAEKDTPVNDVHAVTLLLPWYANGTLGEPERQQCEEHLQTCASCRAELAELRSLQTEIYEVCAETAAAEPTLDTFHRARIRLTN